MILIFPWIEVRAKSCGVKVACLCKLEQLGSNLNPRRQKCVPSIEKYIMLQ